MKNDCDQLGIEELHYGGVRPRTTEIKVPSEVNRQLSKFIFLVYLFIYLGSGVVFVLCLLQGNLPKSPLPVSFKLIFPDSLQTTTCGKL